MTYANCFGILVEAWGGTPHLGGYGPGTYLTDWTGDIPDTATMASLGLKRANAMENEQCDGREAAVCV